MSREAAERLIQLQAKDWLEQQIQDQQNRQYEHKIHTGGSRHPNQLDGDRC
jgi:hypothetical protein